MRPLVQCVSLLEPIITDENNKINQTDLEANACSRRKGREKAPEYNSVCCKYTLPKKAGKYLCGSLCGEIARLIRVIGISQSQTLKS